MSILSGILALDTLVRSAGTLLNHVAKPRAAGASVALPKGNFLNVLEQTIGAKIVAQNDFDGNGSISASEFQGAKSEFKILDADGDGKLTAPEINARYGALLAHRQSESMVNRMMALSDFDSSGGLDNSEMGMTPEEFSVLDVDGDGQLVPVELMQLFTQRGEIRAS